MSRAKIVLIAGYGSLPLVFLERAKKKGLDVVVIQVKGEESPGISKFRYPVYKIPITALGRILKVAKKENAKKILMQGYVRHTNIFKNIRFDLRTLKVLMRARDMRAASLLNEVIKEFKNERLKVMPSTWLLDDLLAGRGTIAGKKPGKKFFEEIKKGFGAAAALAGMDIGQSVVVKKGVVTAAEAQEGTDNCIKRGAKIAGKGFIVIKAARPGQDLRFDVPVMGLKTLKLIKQLGGRGIVVETGKTLLLDKRKIEENARRWGVFVYGYKRR